MSYISITEADKKYDTNTESKQSMFVEDKYKVKASGSISIWQITILRD